MASDEVGRAKHYAKSLGDVRGSAMNHTPLLSARRVQHRATGRALCTGEAEIRWARLQVRPYLQAVSKTGMCALSILLVAGSAHGRSKVEKRSFTHGLEQRTYYLYAPEQLPETGVPLLLTFHGSGRNGESVVEKWTKVADRNGFIVVGLDARNSEVWKAPDDGPEVLRSLVEAVRQEHPVRERRVYLFGHSGGAVFALIMSLMESQYFAAAAVHAGSFRSSAEAALVELVARPIPIKMIVGDRDRFFSVESVEATAALFRDHEIPVEVEVVKGHDHWYYSKAKKFNESAWEFLSKHELAKPPRFTDHAYE